MMKKLIGMAALAAAACAQAPAGLPYSLNGTGQARCYDNAVEIACPAAGQPFYGQDAQRPGSRAGYTVSADGFTVRDNNTGLTWQRSPDTDGNGAITAADKLTWTQARSRPAALNSSRYGGYSDWRLPTIKELYSLIDFRGTDPGAGTSSAGLTPFIDTSAFRFAYGQASAGERIIDSQYASSTLYVNRTWFGAERLFGVNFADGRIKGYDLTMPGGAVKTFFVQCVRGPAYGVNSFADNGDGTVTDRATGLVWAKADSGAGMNWEEALAWVAAKNSQKHLGSSDWRLPNAKELQSIVDYTRSPDSTSSAAIDPVFTSTRFTNEAGQADYPAYWTNTTHTMATAGPPPGGAAVYVSFGRAMGYMDGSWRDVHGAGAQRSDPKAGNPAQYPVGRGPQGDAIRIRNYVRLVRRAPSIASGSPANGATYLVGGMVPGSWAQLRGSGLSNTSRTWNAADFRGLGNNLPTSLDGVEVKVNGLPAAVYFIDPGQINFQVPSAVSGTATVQAFNNGQASNSVSAQAAAASPGIFPVPLNGVNYPAGVFPDGKYVGDPSAGAAFRKARPGDVIQLYATGLAPTPAGVAPSTQALSGVTVTVCSVTVPADYAGLVAAGQFQVNFTVPRAGLSEGAWPVRVAVNGVLSPTEIGTDPPGPLVIPVQP